MSSAAVQKINKPKPIVAPTSSNPGHFLHLQFTVDGLLCDEPCRPDEELDGERDICKVADEDKECIKVASINAMRVIVQESRAASTVEFGTIIAMMETLMTEFAPLQVHNDDVLSKRAEYNVKVAKIRELINMLRGMIKTLEEQAEQVDGLKKILTELKTDLAELKKNWVKSDADCTGMTGYEKEMEGDGITGKYYNNLMWNGDPVIQVDKDIALFLSEEAPNKELNPNNWTAEWEGFIRAPITGEYTFTCESDDGCLV